VDYRPHPDVREWFQVRMFGHDFEVRITEHGGIVEGRFRAPDGWIDCTMAMKMSVLWSERALRIVRDIGENPL
jgi:hypothetical protein